MITERQLSILNAIVEDYVDLGQPIGSKTLIDRHRLDVSPATIRNEMKQLEELNFLEKTHSSSGRSPSEEGFRLYVNQLLKQTSHQNQIKIQRLNQLLIENHYDISSALSYFANELSMKSHYATLVVRPDPNKDNINNVHLIRVNDSIIVLVIIYNSGYVEHLHFNPSISIDTYRLNAISNFINENNINMTLNHIDKIKMFATSTDEEKFIVDIFKFIKSHIRKQSNSIFMGGKVKLIDALNESNVSSIQPILQYIESEKITDLLETITTSDINVRIGKEIDESLSDISIVTSQYHFDDSLKGQIAVIGPTAMHYQNVIQLLNQIW
ncbi:heat-inducible transcription repressor HrcA [Staphylococcus taiwanensis]|nr:heat-inducible transcription repressor HrcA [Staphylococcus taiwanensis]